MTPLEQLKAARELISVPERWTTGFLARNDKGNPRVPKREDATCFCAYGALMRVSGTLDADAMGALDKLSGGDMSTFNDTHTHAEVLAAFDKAIASLEAA